jgi:hypothetical protein
MSESETKFCPHCGAQQITSKEITPNHVRELYCSHCGANILVLWQEQNVVGTTATHDPDSDSEPW